jgi:hypothetical protein
MTLKTYKPSQVVALLDQIEEESGRTAPQACKEGEITVGRRNSAD